MSGSGIGEIDWLDPVQFGRLCEQVEESSRSTSHLARSIDEYVRATNERFSSGQKRFGEIEANYIKLELKQTHEMELFQAEQANRYRTIMIWLIMLTVISLPFRLAELIKLIQSYLVG